MELDLNRNDGSILFTDFSKLKTTNGTQTSVISPRYRFITSFKQLNSSHVVIVDQNVHCIQVYNREDNIQGSLAGTCSTSGFEDGPSAKFHSPWGIEVDERNPGHLLITDRLNHALRLVDVTSSTVSTVIRTGFNNPKELTWYNGRLLVCNYHYISEVTWTSDGTATNNILTGDTISGYRNGDFTGARFNNPFEILQWRDGLFLVADADNKRLRLLDMTKRKVLPVCIGSTTNCTTSTSLSVYPRSLLISNNTVYVGGFNGNGIYKLVSMNNLELVSMYLYDHNGVLFKTFNFGVP